MNNTKYLEKFFIPDSDMKSEILNSIKGISFGEVVITIHNSRIVQIERKEKRRFN
jgi:hypothetical protein